MARQMTGRVAIALALFALAARVSADMYLQYPRGSNNRLDEANRDRTNDNRLFDSQNNNRGGYNVGSTYFYVGSVMNMEWTNQHSCGNPNCNCEIVIQYACDPLLRDGTTTDTIDETKAADTNPKFGRHESYDFYTRQCKWRQRNKGLFNSNRNLNGNNNKNGAIYTRQNENGDRFGFECPEERDYYPYWHPTIWRDLAILTNQAGRCAAYQAESQNVKERYSCLAPDDWVSLMVSQGRNGFVPINQTQCEAIKSPFTRDEFNMSVTGQWITTPAWNMPAPECHENAWTRDNHLGNIAGGEPYTFNWTVAGSVLSERCALRVRYNISTTDFAGFQDAVSIIPPANLTAANNTVTNNNNRDPAKVDVYSRYGLSLAEVNASFTPTTNDPNGNAIKASRDYVLKNNPRVDIFGPLIDRTQSGDPTQPAMLRLQLAINTAQFGRTFEDRSHRFAIRPKPDGIEGRIHNLQVRGKRGNIVQTFPGTEYDFFPKYLAVKNGDYVHFQWTGSNTNPDNNAGQGKAGTDRHNVLILRAPNYDEGQPVTQPVTVGQWGNNYPSRIDTANATNFMGLSYEDLRTLAILNPPQMGGEMSELDDAGTYFDLGPRKVTINGIYHYVCTRNNNFSNRDQKGALTVSDSAAAFGSLGSSGGAVRADSGASVSVNAGALTSLITVTIITMPRSTDSSFSGSVDSDYVQVVPLFLPLAPGQYVTISLPYDYKPLILPAMYRSDSLDGSWTTVDGASFSSSGTASADVSQGGYYVVQTKVNWPAVVGVIIGALAFVAAVVGGMYYKYRQNINKDTGPATAVSMAPKAVPSSPHSPPAEAAADADKPASNV
jgi:hypothetical protein